MTLGLAYRVEPEIDERSAEREAREFSSKLSEELSEIEPLEAQQMFGDDIEEYLEETDEMISEFSFEGLQDPSGFGGDVLYGQGPAEMPQHQQQEESLFETFAPEIFGEVVAENFFSQDEPLDVNRIDDEGDGGMGVFQTIAIGSLLNDLVKEPIGEQLKDVGGILAAVKTGSLKTAAATTTLGALFVGGLAGVVVGGLALSFLEGIVNSLAQQSPLLASVLDIFGLAVSLFFRPFGDLLAQALLPIGVALLELAAGFNEVASGEGIAAGIAYLFDRLIGALFSLDGLFVAALTGAATVIGGALGAVIGSFVAAKTGAVVGATIGSIIPGGGTVIGAGIGAILGLIVGLLSSLLIVFNVDLKAILNDLKEEFFLSIKPVTDFLATIQNLLIGYLIAYYEFKANVEQFLDKKLGQVVTYLKELFNTFQEGGFSAVIDKLLDDTGLNEFLADIIPEFDVFEWLKDQFPGWPNAIENFDVYETLENLFPGWPDAIENFGVYEALENLFPGWPDSAILSFNVYDAILNLFPGWPSGISSFNVYNQIRNAFPGWPDSISDFDVYETVKSQIPEIDWNLSGFDWGDFIPTISFDLPDFPGWEAVVTGAADTVGSVIDAFENIGSGSQPEQVQPQQPEVPDDDDDDDPSTGVGSGIGGSIPGAPDDAGVDDEGDPPNAPASGYRPPSGVMASGGIVTDAMMAMIGEGRETEVVQPLSQLNRFVDSRQPVQNSVNVNQSNDISQSDIEDAFRRALDRADITDNEDVTTELQKVRTEIRRMRDEMDINVEFKDSSKWEVNK